MNIKRTASLLFTLIGLMGFAQAGKLPADPRFDVPVKVDIPASGVSAEIYLKAIGATVKLNVVAEAVPERKINDNFNGKPFRRVWETVTTLLDLDFELLQDDIMIVGPVNVVARFRTPPVQTGVQTYTYVVNSDAASIQALLAKQFPSASISSIANSKILVINATPGDYEKISALLKSVDLAPAIAVIPQTTRKIFKLSNAKAVDLAKVISTAITGPSTTPNAQGADTTTITTLPGQAQAATAKVNVPTTVVADEGSNSLIVSGLPEAVESIAQLLPILDSRQGMVNVNVRIQEVSDDASRTLGIDWQFGFGNFAGKLLSNGLNFIFDATSGLAGLNIGAALNALESKSLSKRINDSNITVLNNGAAKIRSGGRIEVSIPGTASNIEKTINYGVQLEVKPRISNDGTITLYLKAEVSDVQNKGSLNPNRIDFDERTTETTVTLQSGETVLLGSLLATTNDASETGIPLLSAIPLIGDVFKTRKTNDRQTQLLVVLTANLVK